MHNKEEQQHKTEEVQETIKTYEILIEDFKAELFSQIQQQERRLVSEVQVQIDNFMGEEDKKEDLEDLKV